MALLPAGSFAMGDRKDRVKVGKLCMDITEVTAEAYATCVRVGQCTSEGLSCGPASTFGAAGKGEHPINCVDWSQASTYCQAQGKRLPSEEEWEWAARGGAMGKTYPWGNVEPTSQVCWSGYGLISSTCPAGSFLAGASPQGIFDLSGNVWEWTSSKKDEGSSERVARGGAWSSSASSYLRASERYWTSPLYRFIYIGFRCVKGA
jgi:formylglycine-generating enzyme required for sulfatase activity